MRAAGIDTPEDIDKALKLGLNHPMGPFELVDLVGLDVRLKILEYLHQTLGEKYRPNSLLRQYVEEGRLGRKDRKSTRLNSSHLVISYAVFCLKKKKKIPDDIIVTLLARTHHLDGRALASGHD